ncbi:MAG: rhodanese-like domain-containing protein [Bacteriovoracaceae bacterium]
MLITVTKVKQWMDQGKPVHLLDVRTQEESIIASLGGALIPVQELEARFKELDSMKRPWVVYCHHGVRSEYAAQFLKMRGYDALSLVGGIEKWSLEIDSSVPIY